MFSHTSDRSPTRRNDSSEEAESTLNLRISNEEERWMLSPSTWAPGPEEHKTVIVNLWVQAPLGVAYGILALWFIAVAKLVLKWQQNSLMV